MARRARRVRPTGLQAPTDEGLAASRSAQPRGAGNSVASYSVALALDAANLHIAPMNPVDPATSKCAGSAAIALLAVLTN